MYSIYLFYVVYLINTRNKNYFAVEQFFSKPMFSDIRIYFFLFIFMITFPDFLSWKTIKNSLIQCNWMTKR